MGDDLWATLRDGLKEDAPTSIRLNPFKCDLKATEVSEADGIVPWCEGTGYYIKNRPNFTFDPLLHAGSYYVQEASSMFVNAAIKQYVSEPVMMLDLCAAPGGKSTAARAALPEGSLLFSNEPMRTRAQILAENIQKFGHEDVIVTNNYPRDYKKSKLSFDVILTDVPCSGEGMFRKDEGARSEWSTQNVDNCWHLQREIVSDIWKCLKPGGLLIYSTCTFNAHEDEDNVNWIINELGAELLPVNTKGEWHITNALTGDNKDMYRFIPGKSRGEGLFLAVLRKTDDEAFPEPKLGKKKDKEKNKAKMPVKIDKSWLINADDMTFSQAGDDIIAVPSRWSEIYKLATKSLNIISSGITLGTIKGKNIIPAQSLALSRCLNRKAFNEVEVNYEQAISYLRTEAITLPADAPTGFTLLTYRNTPIGFVKNIGTRANNLYPQEWKIKSSHVPEENRVLLFLKTYIKNI